MAPQVAPQGAPAAAQRKQKGQRRKPKQEQANSGDCVEIETSSSS
jgi:hypothetical protein